MRAVGAEQYRAAGTRFRKGTFHGQFARIAHKARQTLVIHLSSAPVLRSIGH